MKRITIGRSKDCDILIQDESEKSSRKHAVITFSFFGKMRIYDTSSNGTIVNGEKIEKPESRPIKRGDKIEFAKDVFLDWDQIKDPYTKIRIPLIFLFVAVVVSVALLLIFVVDFDKKQNEEIEEETTIEQTTDTVAQPKDTVQLTDTQEPATPRARSGKKQVKTPDANKGKTIGDMLKDNKEEGNPSKDNLKDKNDGGAKGGVINPQKKGSESQIKINDSDMAKKRGEKKQ